MHLPDYRAEKVWLVEQKDGHERYSNGGRILTEYETDNHPRAYHLFARGTGTVIEADRREPVGIVFTVRERHSAFTPAQHDPLNRAKRGFLSRAPYRSYNYIVDRFGQIYRIGATGTAATTPELGLGRPAWGLRGLNRVFHRCRSRRTAPKGRKTAILRGPPVSGPASRKSSAAVRLEYAHLRHARSRLSYRTRFSVGFPPGDWARISRSRRSACRQIQLCRRRPRRVRLHLRQPL